MLSDAISRDCIDQYGFNYWTEFFSPRQLLGHCTGVEVFHELVDETERRTRRTYRDSTRPLSPISRSPLDKMLNYNSRACFVASQHARCWPELFDRHDFAFKWSFAEMAPDDRGFGLSTGSSSRLARPSRN